MRTEPRPTSARRTSSPLRALVGLTLLLAAARGHACEIVGVAGGAAHSLALDEDGLVWSWGANASGQLGLGDTVGRTTPESISTSSSFSSVGAGASHSAAVDSLGRVWCWGLNSSGQLGNGTTTDSSVAVQANGLTGATAVEGGSAHTVARKGDGTVWAWGANGSGQLGDGSYTGSSLPVQVSGLTGVTAVAAGDLHSLALKGDGTVWAWGENANGQLGDGTTTDSNVPVQVSGLTGVTAIAAGGSFSLALRRDGTARAWGANASGQLGDGTTVDSSLPVAVSGLTSAVKVAAGGAHALALRTDQTLRAWGANGSGQLGNGTTTSSSLPVAVPAPKADAVGAGQDHSLEVDTAKVPWAWGANASGQLGNGTTNGSSLPHQLVFFRTSPACACREVRDHLVGYPGAKRLAVQNFINGLGYVSVIADVRSPNGADANRGSFLARLNSLADEPAFLAALDANGDVRYHEKDCRIFSRSCVPYEPQFPIDRGYRPANNTCQWQDEHSTESYQWGMERVGFTPGCNTWRMGGGTDPRTVVAAVLDTGANFQHEDFNSGQTFGADLDFVNGYAGPPPLYQWQNDADGALDDDPQRHGTMVTGVIGAWTDQTDRGVAGGACLGTHETERATSLLIYKVLDSTGVGQPSRVALAIQYAVLNGAEVIHMSLGSLADSRAVKEACESARIFNNRMLIASAGNYGTNWVTYPAAYDTVQGVGATNALNQLPVFTDRGPGVDVWAPGTRILSTGDVVRDSVQTWFAYHEGTSYAAPLVTAAAILGRSLRSPSLGPGPVECTLRSSAYPPIDPVNGTGLLHVANFLATLPSSGPSPCDTRIPEAPPEVIPPPSSEDQFEGGGLVTPVLEPSAIP